VRSSGVITIALCTTHRDLSVKVCIFILLATAPLFGQSIKSISGTITNSSGESIHGVKVCTASWICVQSNAFGHYIIDNKYHTIRFSHPEYNALIKHISDDLINVVLQKTTQEYDNIRTVSNCSINEKLIGWRLKLIIYSENIIKSKDNNYESITVPSSENKNEQLVLVNGSSATFGMPPWPTRNIMGKFPAIIYDRDIVFLNRQKTEHNTPILSDIDIKVQTYNGKFWRYIGNSFQFIYYYDVSDVTSREFDEIMDTLCVQQP